MRQFEDEIKSVLEEENELPEVVRDKAAKAFTKIQSKDKSVEAYTKATKAFARIQSQDKTLNGVGGYTQRRKGHFFSMPKTAVAACIFGMTVLVAVPVAAKVNSIVTERMEQMSKEEKQVYEEMNEPENQTKEHETEAIRYSRELSADEDKRMNELWDKYEEGLFPEGEMQIIDKLEADMEITAPVYEIWNREFYLPERDLTDEELLQMVDLMQKQAYTVENSDESKKWVNAQQEFFENPNPGENDMSEDEAIAKASAYLEGMYNVDADGMEKTVEFTLGVGLEEGGYGDYAVTFKGDEDWSYEVDINGETGVLTGIWLRKVDTTWFFSTAPATVNEQIRSTNYEKAKEKIIAILGEDAKIVKSNCEYNEDKDGNAEYGMLCYLFQLENGYVYQICYAIEEDLFNQLYMFEGDDISSHTPREEDGYVIFPME